MTPEGRVKAMINRRLEQHFGARFYRFMPVQNGMGAPGLDYHCCVDGVAVFIEAKVPGKSMRPRQRATADMIRRAGGLVFEIHDAAECDAMLEQIDTVLKHSIVRHVIPRDVL